MATQDDLLMEVMSDSSNDSVIVTAPIPDSPPVEKKRKRGRPRKIVRQDETDKEQISRRAKAVKIQELEDLVNASASIPIAKKRVEEEDNDAWSGSDTKSSKGNRGQEAECSKYLKKIKTLQQNKRRQETRIAKLNKDVKTLRDKNSVQAAYIDVLCGMLGGDVKKRFKGRQGLRILGNTAVTEDIAENVDDDHEIENDDRNEITEDETNQELHHDGEEDTEQLEHQIEDENELKEKEHLEYYCVEDLNDPATERDFFDETKEDFQNLNVKEVKRKRSKSNRNLNLKSKRSLKFPEGSPPVTQEPNKEGNVNPDLSHEASLVSSECSASINQSLDISSNGASSSNGQTGKNSEHQEVCNVLEALNLSHNFPQALKSEEDSNLESNEFPDRMKPENDEFPDRMKSENDEFPDRMKPVNQLLSDTTKFLDEDSIIKTESEPTSTSGTASTITERVENRSLDLSSSFVETNISGYNSMDSKQPSPPKESEFAQSDLAYIIRNQNSLNELFPGPSSLTNRSVAISKENHNPYFFPGIDSGFGFPVNRWFDPPKNDLTPSNRHDNLYDSNHVALCQSAMGYCIPFNESSATSSEILPNMRVEMHNENQNPYITLGLSSGCTISNRRNLGPAVWDAAVPVASTSKVHPFYEPTMPNHVFHE